METNSIEFGKKLKQIREDRGFSIRQTALQAGTSNPYISQVENGKRNIPKPTTLEKLAKGLRISKEEMFKLAGLEVSHPTNVEPMSSNFINIPVIGKIECGEPIIAEQNISGYVPIPADVVKKGNYFILNCIEHSMEPTISNGSQVVVREQPDAESGQIAAVLLEDENTATLKRIKKTKTSVILLPDNPEYELIILNEDKRGRILGIVKMEMKRF